MQRYATTRNNIQQHATTCNDTQRRAATSNNTQQHATTCNNMQRPLARRRLPRWGGAGAARRCAALRGGRSSARELCGGSAAARAARTCAVPRRTSGRQKPCGGTEFGISPETGRPSQTGSAPYRFERARASSAAELLAEGRALERERERERGRQRERERGREREGERERGREGGAGGPRSRGPLRGGGERERGRGRRRI